MTMSNTKSKFTDIVFIPVTPQNGLIGFMNCLFDGKVYLSSIAVKVKPDGTLYLLCPSKRFNEKTLQYFYPINKETYEAMVDAVRPQVAEFLKGESNG